MIMSECPLPCVRATEMSILRMHTITYLKQVLKTFHNFTNQRNAPSYLITLLQHFKKKFLFSLEEGSQPNSIDSLTKCNEFVNLAIALLNGGEKITDNFKGFLMYSILGYAPVQNST